VFELGQSLRDVRTRQGLDYAQVELATKIRAKYIQAIEDEQFGILPAQPYVRGFLRSYADFLGLDGQVYVDEYDSRFLADGFDDAPRRDRRPRPTRDRRRVERRMVLLALAGVVAVTALVIAAWKFGGGNPSSSTPPIVTGKPAAPLGLALRGVGGGTYVEVRRRTGAGAIVFQGTLRTGEREFVPGTAFWILLRHPQGARVTLGGKPVSLPAIRDLKVLVGRDYITRANG
jgi:cytoskeleton protein RodZ